MSHRIGVSSETRGTVLNTTFSADCWLEGLVRASVSSYTQGSGVSQRADTHQYEPWTSGGSPTVTRSWDRGLGHTLPQNLQKGPVSPAPLFQMSSLLNSEGRCFWIF